MSSDTFSDRLRNAINGRSLRSFGAECGLSEGALRKYLADKSEPGMAALVAMARAAEVRVEWLATGEGPMYSEVCRFCEEVTVNHGEQGAQINLDDYVMVLRYGVQAGAGSEPVESDQCVDFLAFRRRWVACLGLQADCLALIRAVGDSMEPTIKDGFLLLVDLRQQEIKVDAIYVLRMGHELVVKRCQKLFAGEIKMISDNPAYDEQLIPADQVGKLEIIGRVVWGGGRM